MAFKNSNLLSNLFINLAGSSTFALITIVVIEFLRDAKLNSETLDAKKAALADVERLSNMLIWWIAEPISQETILDYKVEDTKSIDAQNKATAIMITKLQAMNINKSLTDMEPERWQRMILNLSQMKGQMNEYAQYYASSCDRRVYARYLACRSVYASLLRSLTVPAFSDILAKDESQWPKNKYGPERNRAIRTSLIESVAEDTEEYLLAVGNLFESTTAWRARLIHK